MNAASGWSVLFEAMPWIDTLGLSLLHFLWQGSAIGLVAGLVLIVLKRRPPQTRSSLSIKPRRI